MRFRLSVQPETPIHWCKAALLTMDRGIVVQALMAYGVAPLREGLEKVVEYKREAARLVARAAWVEVRETAIARGHRPLAEDPMPGVFP